jgi:hypothetical protein
MNNEDNHFDDVHINILVPYHLKRFFHIFFNFPKYPLLLLPLHTTAADNSRNEDTAKEREKLK